jgi:hypothetical protein
MASGMDAPFYDHLLDVLRHYAPNQSQCYVRLPFADLGNYSWRLHDLIGDAMYDREGTDPQARGLYLDMYAWQTSIFALKARVHSTTSAI